jgi:hypothetical protein
VGPAAVFHLTVTRRSTEHPQQDAGLRMMAVGKSIFNVSSFAQLHATSSSSFGKAEMQLDSSSNQ